VNEASDRINHLFADIRSRFLHTLIHKEQFVPCRREQRRGVRWPGRRRPKPAMAGVGRRHGATAPTLVLFNVHGGGQEQKIDTIQRLPHSHLSTI